ncbi:MAG: 4-hydroxythreonine-4-phosphate dehydrogenase PdxA [Planctomycetia bacterium]|jgi:4-hydroxythreonine-4-phosphate dehydrogenase
MKRIAITMGDPAGVGPELCLKLFNDPRVTDVCRPVLYGDLNVLQRVSDVLQERGEAAYPLPESVVDCRAIEANDFRPGKISAECGKASYRYIDTAIRAAMAEEVAAVVTAPIHKEALHAAGVPYPGHTEMFVDKTGAKEHCMMLSSAEVTAALVTAHVGYGDVPGLLSVERILEVIRLAFAAMTKLRGHRAKLIVCGLNPHAGEHGLFGNGEEERFIRPAVVMARSEGIEVEGPLPPDTAFLPDRLAWADAHVCMYHDQGLIPMKMLGFERGVNVTLGLPIVRTSVDHGTAMDIAWTGKASVESFVQAVLMAVALGK